MRALRNYDFHTFLKAGGNQIVRGDKMFAGRCALADEICLLDRHFANLDTRSRHES